MNDDARMIEVGGREVGMVGLDELFVELSELASEIEPGSLRRKLLEGAARRNYVPEALRGEYAEALYIAFRAFLEGESEPDRSGPTWRGIPRRDVEWYPTIDDDLCDGCRKCLDFCSFGVFTYSAERDVVEVGSPYACVVGCSLCSSLCSPRAIAFPPLSYLDRFK